MCQELFSAAEQYTCGLVFISAAEVSGTEQHYTARMNL